MSLVAAQLDGGQDPQGSSPGDCLRPVVGVEFAIDIAGVGLDRVQREEKPGSDFLIGQSFGDELQYFKFALAQRFNQIRFLSLRYRWTRGLRFSNGERC